MASTLKVQVKTIISESKKVEGASCSMHLQSIVSITEINLLVEIHHSNQNTSPKTYVSTNLAKKSGGINLRQPLWTHNRDSNLFRRTCLNQQRAGKNLLKFFSNRTPMLGQKTHSGPIQMPSSVSFP